MNSSRRVLIALAFAALAGAANAQTLTIGAAFTTTSFDPHFHVIGFNIALTRHVFDPLIAQDEQQRLKPALALSWTATGPTTWRLALRPGVRFHDGSPFTSDDVVFTLARAPAVPNSPSSFAMYTQAIAKVEAVDPLTVDIHTHASHPTLPIELSTIGVLSRSSGATATTADFNSGRAAIGTGPFKFVEWTPGQRTVFSRNDAYWAAPAAWEQVVIRQITNDSTRVAALLAGDVDMVEAVPPSAIEILRARGDVRIASTPSNRVIYLFPNHALAADAHSTALDGGALASNPFSDRRVREALSLAIDRTAIVDRVLMGLGDPAGQFLPAGYFGVDPGLRAPGVDLGRARELLAAAGLANGFATTLHTPNDRYIRDEQVAQTIAQMAARIGIRMRIEAQPSSILITRLNKFDFAIHIWGWSSETGEPVALLRTLLGTRGRSPAFGQSNRGRFSNPILDQLVDVATTELDDRRRETLAIEATAFAMRDLPVLPLHFQTATWALRQGFDYGARADNYTLAYDVRPIQVKRP